VIYASISRGLSHTFLIPEQDNLNVGVERAPTLHCVALDVADVPSKWLRHSEDREHAGEGTAGDYLPSSPERSEYDGAMRKEGLPHQCEAQ
jgi:hypothetical protein